MRRGAYNGGMQVILNGQAHPCPDGCTVAQLLLQAGHAQRRVAVEVNRSIVPRSQHATHVLQPDDRVELVHAIGGG